MRNGRRVTIGKRGGATDRKNQESGVGGRGLGCLAVCSRGRSDRAGGLWVPRLSWPGKKKIGFPALELLDGLAKLGRSSFCVAGLLYPPPLIHFSPQEVVCTSCGGALKVSKTKPERLVYTLHIGAFRIHETWKVCADCATVYRCGELERIIPTKCNFGFDVIVRVGRRLFLDNRTLVEAKAELATENVRISVNGISFLGEKFIAYLSLAHRRAAHSPTFPSSDCKPYPEALLYFRSVTTISNQTFSNTFVQKGKYSIYPKSFFVQVL